MTTPTDDEIVKYVLAQDWGYAGTAVRQALRIAREGFPVPDEAEIKEFAERLAAALNHSKSEAITFLPPIIRTFLANRDAERDEMVAELVAAAKDGASYLGRTGLHGAGIGQRIDAALAKLERKP